jgi:membrane protein
VLVGSFITAVLFELGKLLIGVYLGQHNPGSAYGAAGSIILILVWFSYSSLIFFLGAEFTQVYARRFGKQIEPKAFAVRVDQPERDFPEGQKKGEST